MSRVVGPVLEPRLLDYFSQGRPVVVALVTDQVPTGLLGRGLRADRHNVVVETDAGLSVGDRVSIHTLGPDICALLGEVTDVTELGKTSTADIIVKHVKDDRPPGLDVRPFEILGSQ
jgi:hypothetical protein